MRNWFSKEPLHEPIADPAPGSRREVKTTTCYMCACRCGIRVHLRDGELRYIDGNPEHPINKGVICAKGCRWDFPGMKPKDMIDIQSFIWVQGSSEYDE